WPKLSPTSASTLRRGPPSGPPEARSALQQASHQQAPGPGFPRGQAPARLGVACLFLVLPGLGPRGGGAAWQICPWLPFPADNVNEETTLAGPEPSAGGGECSVARTGVKMRGLAGRGLQSLSFQLALAMALMALAAAGVSVSLLLSDSSGELLAQAQEALLIEQHLHAQTLAQEVAEKLDAVSHLNSRLKIGRAHV